MKLTLLCLLASAASLFAAEKPNIVFILADDLGWADTTLYGHTKYYKTPNIERLAKRGMTFTRAYSDSPLCSPTRSAILTGQSPARTGITAPNCHLGQVILEATPGAQAAPGQKSTTPTPPTRLKTEYDTLPETLKAAGYATGHFGKWHLGLEPYSPLQHGFDVDIPHWPGPGPAGSFVAPWKYPDFDPQTPNAFLGTGAGMSGPATIKFRVQSPGGGDGKIEWIQGGAPGESVPFSLKETGDWQEMSVKIPSDKPLGILRVYLPAHKNPVKVDWIQLKAKRWNF